MTGLRLSMTCYLKTNDELIGELELKIAIIKSTGKTADNLASSKADAKRLQAKVDAALSTIEELRLKQKDSIPRNDLYAALDAKRIVDEDLLTARDEISYSHDRLEAALNAKKSAFERLSAAKDEIRQTSEELAYSSAQFSIINVKLENLRRNTAQVLQLSKPVSDSEMLVTTPVVCAHK